MSTKSGVPEVVDRVEAKFLMTPIQNTIISGYALRKTHHHLGRYLALDDLEGLLGIEKHSISHFHGHKISIFRGLYGYQTLNVASCAMANPWRLLSVKICH